jgi:hypothetical protein
VCRRWLRRPIKLRFTRKASDISKLAQNVLYQKSRGRALQPLLVTLNGGMYPILPVNDGWRIVCVTYCKLRIVGKDHPFSFFGSEEMHI